MESKFIADNNVGKLARWLRVIGYDTLLFEQKDDNGMIRAALDEDRVILTKDAEFMRRRLVTSGELKAVLIETGDPGGQVRKVVEALDLDYHFKPFSLCLECNQPLVPRSRGDVRSLVPPYVYQTQTQYTQCPTCHRVYWPGTHWRAMVKKLQDLQRESGKNHTPG
jgi:hypothetical protein